MQKETKSELAKTTAPLLNCSLWKIPKDLLLRSKLNKFSNEKANIHFRLRMISLTKTDYLQYHTAFCKIFIEKLHLMFLYSFSIDSKTLLTLYPMVVLENTSILLFFFLTS